jgi:hypothetical protein
MIMDPNAMLAELREKIKEGRARAPFSEDGWAWNEIVDAFQAIDGFLSAGGCLPEDWAR